MSCTQDIAQVAPLDEEELEEEVVEPDEEELEEEVVEPDDELDEDVVVLELHISFAGAGQLQCLVALFIKTLKFLGGVIGGFAD